MEGGGRMRDAGNAVLPPSRPSSSRLPPFDRSPSSRSGFRLTALAFLRARAGVEAAHARLVDDADVQVAGDVHLAREAHVLGEARLQREAVALGLTHLAGVATQNLDAAGRALRV